MDNATSAIDQVEANVPVSFYVLKVASRCNLNCKYCYMYNLGDLSYQGQPKVMSDAVITAMVTKIKLHSAKHNLRSVVMVFHGGEPMLAGMVFFSQIGRRSQTESPPRGHTALLHADKRHATHARVDQSFE